MKQYLGEKNEARMYEGKRDKQGKGDIEEESQVEPDSSQTLQPRRHLSIVSPIYFWRVFCEAGNSIVMQVICKVSSDALVIRVRKVFGV